MTVDWQNVNFSTRIVAEAYDEENQIILVRFPNGIEWYYAACPPEMWESFTAPGQSRGQFIHHVLNNQPHGRWQG